MKRVVLLILALFLLLDLAEDGCLGKATFVPCQSSAKISFTSTTPKIDSLEKVDSLKALPLLGWTISCLRPDQLVSFEGLHTLKIIIPTNKGSSGGIPL